MSSRSLRTTGLFIGNNLHDGRNLSQRFKKLRVNTFCGCLSTHKNAVKLLVGDVIDKIGDAQPVVIRKGNGGLNGITNGDRGAGGRSIKCLCSGSFEPFSKQERLPDEFPGPENQNTFPLWTETSWPRSAAGASIPVGPGLFSTGCPILLVKLR